MLKVLNVHVHQVIVRVCRTGRQGECSWDGGGGGSLDRLEGPATLHILSSGIVCWGSSDYP